MNDEASPSDRPSADEQAPHPAAAHHPPYTDDGPPTYPPQKPFPVALLVLGIVGGVVLIGILLIVILAAIMLPTVVTIREKARIQETSNNLKRIVEAQIAFASMNQGEWAQPAGYDLGSGTAGLPGDAREAVPYVGAIFVTLAKHNELSPKLFANPTHAIQPDMTLPHMTLSAEEIARLPADRPGVALSWAASFAYDYACPPHSSSGRPIVGDRDPDVWGGKLVCVAYGDGHAVPVDVLPGTGRTITVDPGPTLGGPVAYDCVSRENVIDDGLYRPEPGEVGVWTPGRGSTTLAWLR